MRGSSADESCEALNDGVSLVYKVRVGLEQGQGHRSPFYLGEDIKIFLWRFHNIHTTDEYRHS